MLYRWPLFAVASLVFSSVGHAASTGVTSDAAAACAGLLLPTEINQKSSVSLFYAYNRLADAHSKNSSSSRSDANIPIMNIGFSGSDSYSAESRRLEEIGIKWDYDASSSFIARYLPANQSKDYLACVTKVISQADASVGIELDDVINDNATFTVHVRPTNGISVKRKLVIWTNGTPKGTWQKDFDIGQTSTNVIVGWPDKNKPLVFRAQMKQVGAGDSMIGQAARFILWPDLIEKSIIKKSSQAEARYPNQHAPGRYYSNEISVQAASDEILLPSSARMADDEWLAPTWGQQRGLHCSEFGVDFDAKNDGQRVAGRVYCSMGYADENPGVKAAFVVKAIKVTVPVPDTTIKMDEKRYD